MRKHVSDEKLITEFVFMTFLSTSSSRLVHEFSRIQIIISLLPCLISEARKMELKVFGEFAKF